MSTFNILRIVWTLIHSDKPLSQTELGKVTNLTRAAVSKLSKGGKFAFLPFIKASSGANASYPGLPPAGRTVHRYTIGDVEAANRFVGEVLQVLAEKAQVEKAVLELLIIGKLTSDERAKLSEVRDAAQQRLTQESS